MDWNIGHYIQEFNAFLGAMAECKKEDEGYGERNGKLLDLRINTSEYIQRWSKVNGRRNRYTR